MQSTQRVAEIQAALQAAQLDGWLFYDFRHSDPLAYRILKLDPHLHATRRWYYFVPATGEPSRQPVRMIVEGADRRLDALEVRGPHRGAGIEHAIDGGHAHAGARRNILDGGLSHGQD